MTRPRDGSALGVPETAAAAVVGVDVGGTFTDFVAIVDGQLRIDKRPTTPENPADAVAAGVTHLDPDARSSVRHGTTTATNALLERRGARTAFVTNAGFEDLLALGRGDRRDLYALMPTDRPVLVPPERCFGLAARVGPDGRVLREPTSDELRATVDAVLASGAESVAVCLLWAHLNGDHEQAVAAKLLGRNPVLSITLSSEVLPVFREYERASTAVVNAYVAPVIDRYLADLDARLAPRRLRIMTSAGGTVAPAEARRVAASTALSGPAAGVVGATAVARANGTRRLISFDMGGTSTDVSLVDGELPVSAWCEIDGLPIHLPSVVVETVGAGGGSVVDWEAGALKVGPTSAGARPGPAAYGRGGSQATVTDAHVVLGRLPAATRLAGEMGLDPEAARRAMGAVAARAGVSIEALATSTIEVANAAMERALRRVSVAQGHDPEEFTLVAFGGAGPLHCCELAAAVGCRRIVLPAAPGVLSAQGLATAPPAAVALRSVVSRDALGRGGVVTNRGAGGEGRRSDAGRGGTIRDAARLETLFQTLEERATAQLGTEPASLRRVVEARYRGQSWELDVAWPDAGLVGLEAAFHAVHDRRFGYSRPGEAVEPVTLRVHAEGVGQDLPGGSAFDAGRSDLPRLIRVFIGGQWQEIPWLPRSESHGVVGPAILRQSDTTAFLAPGWRATRGSGGDTVLVRT